MYQTTRLYRRCVKVKKDVKEKPSGASQHGTRTKLFKVLGPTQTKPELTCISSFYLFALGNLGGFCTKVQAYTLCACLALPRGPGTRLHTTPYTTLHTGSTRAVHFFSSDRTRASVSLCSVIRRRCQVAHVLIRLVVHELAFVLFRAVFAEGHDLGRGVRVQVQVHVQV